MKLRELGLLTEFAITGGGDSYNKVRDVIVEQILKTVKLDKKQMVEMKEALEHADADDISEIVEIIDAIVEWYDEDANGVSVRTDWYEVGNYSISNFYYQSVATIYDYAWTQVYDKKKAILRKAGTPYSGEPNDLFPYIDKIDHEVADVGQFVKDLFKVFPTFSVAVKKGIQNSAKRKK